MSSQWQFNIIIVFVQQTDYESIHCINRHSPKIGCQSIADNNPAFHQALLTVQWYPYSFLFQGGFRHCESEWGVLHKNTLTWLLLTVGIQYPEFNILTIGQPHHQWRDVFEELMQKQCITDNFYKYMSVMISISQKETIIHLKPTVWTLLKNLGFLGLYLSDHRYVCGKKQSYSPLWSGEIWNRAFYCQLNHTCIIFIPLCRQASLTFCVTGTGTLNDSSSAPMPLLASAATIPADAALLSFTK